jgi:hypothetical protein
MTQQHVSVTLACLLALTASVDLRSQTSPSVPITAMTRSDIKKLSRTAHTPEQYGVLAIYFRQQETQYRTKASDEKAEWERRKQITGGVWSKYPTPSDSARNLYDYYVYQANDMSAKAGDYERRSITQ